jgi:hypothetical protein
MTAMRARRGGRAGVAENSAGEREPDRLSRRANLLEVAGLYLVLLATWWIGLGRLSERAGLGWLRGVAVAVVAAAVAWISVGAPRLHGDGWHAMGLGRPAAPFTKNGAREGAPAAATLVVFGVAALLVWLNWDYLLIRLGLHQAGSPVYEALARGPWRTAGQVAAALAIGTLFAAFGIRWDNLPSAFRAASWLALLFGGAIELGAVAAWLAPGGHDPFAGFVWVGNTGKAFLTHLSLYVLWAPLQQFFVLGYVNTRVRKGIPASFAGGRGRLATAFLTGAAFAGLHLPGWPLAALTFAGGCAYGWLFQRDRDRNLFAVGLAHAFIGTLIATTTSISMVVGPQ